MIPFIFYNNGWVLLLAEIFCYRVACLWAFSRIGKQRGRGPEVESRKGTPLHAGLWKAVMGEPGKNWEGIWWTPQSSGWARPCPSRPGTLETGDAAPWRCSFKFRTDRRKYYIENVGIYYKGGYILIQTMASKGFYVEKTKNHFISSLDSQI